MFAFIWVVVAKRLITVAQLYYAHNCFQNCDTTDSKTEAIGLRLRGSAHIFGVSRNPQSPKLPQGNDFCNSSICFYALTFCTRE